ncbi:ATP-dependent nuclease [Vibrio sp. 10N.286.48.B7]|uniref:ATP-dependent nuclease n=1 Tax=Vibrio sp. 10N.286.48.B7 TaxID=1880853 RepID=UPI000C85D8EF|nr:AAA family ATPase [Vibrio sp. 10N.286.48.B7]PMH81529.1 ATP-dependent endonuclease [Vibrio sp. 10N.286.48.B7]
MAILINAVRISGFRGISNLEISLPKVAVLIGQNNAGKTSIIKALQLALGDYSRHLTDEDFYIDCDDNVRSEIIVDISIVPVDESSQRTNIFTDEWVEVFGDWVQADLEENDFVAIRTICEKDSIKGGFKVSRYPLSRWSGFENWTDESAKINNKISKRIDAIPFVAIDAQRDIHQELREKTSYIGKVLSDISFESEDKEALEDLIAELNESAVEKSTVLSELKTHLDSLSQSFEGQGQTDITPFPKKIRDLSKRFSIHFGEDDTNSFSMEYHGMGTRSWASMLTVKAFIDILEKKHVEEEECFFPIIAAEEPEAHLHPNAQRTLYKQLTDIKGQTIISSHSPYLASECKLQDLRSLRNGRYGVEVNSLGNGFAPEDINKLQRDVMRFRGEVLFSKAIILFEGVTEEQLAPIFFEKYFSKSCYAVGVNCVSVAGKNYPPFVKLAYRLGIPVCIVSDNDGTTFTEISSQIRKIETEFDCQLLPNDFVINYLNQGCDIEKELVNHVGLVVELKKALVRLAVNGNDHPGYIEAKTREIDQFDNDRLLTELKNSKSGYSGFLAEIISDSDKEPNELIPQAFINAFESIREWSVL